MRLNEFMKMNEADEKEVQHKTLSQKDRGHSFVISSGAEDGGKKWKSTLLQVGPKLFVFMSKDGSGNRVLEPETLETYNSMIAAGKLTIHS